MKRVCAYSILLSAALLLTRCATVFNSGTKLVGIATSKPAIIILNNDTFPTVNNRALVRIERRKFPLKIRFASDSITKTITVNSRNSFAWYLNAYPTPMFWTGFIIDQKNPKRYTYPGRIYVDVSDSTSGYLRYDAQSRKGQLLLNFSFPWVNNFYFKPEHEDYKAAGGFWGIAAGLDYYHCPHQFFSLSASAVMDFLVPFPAPVHYSGPHQRMSSSYIGLSNSHKVRNFSLGYGLTYTRNTWELRNYTSTSDSITTDLLPRKISGNAIGLMFPAYYYFRSGCYAGVIYRPTFFRLINSSQLAYEHLISITFGATVRLKNR